MHMHTHLVGCSVKIFSDASFLLVVHRVVLLTQVTVNNILHGGGEEEEVGVE